MTKIEEKEYHIGTAEKKLSFCLIKNINLLIFRPTKKHVQSKIQEKPSALKREHPSLPEIKFKKIFVGNFCPPRSRDPIESGFNPVPHHCP
jgi:hypothetical protein